MLKPIKDNVLVEKAEDTLSLDGLELKQTTRLTVIAKGGECSPLYNVGDVVECYAQEELPRADGKTYILKDKMVLGVENEE